MKALCGSHSVLTVHTTLGVAGHPGIGHLNITPSYVSFFFWSWSVSVLVDCVSVFKWTTSVWIRAVKALILRLRVNSLDPISNPVTH